MVSFFALLGAAILVGFAVMKARASAPFRRVVVPGHLAVGVRIARRRSLVRIAIAIAVAVVVGVAGLGVNAATPDLFGLPLLLTPLAMTCAGFIVIAVWPQVAVAETAVHRSADLIPRGPWSYIPGWSLALTAFSAVLVLVAVLVFGVTSSPQPDGLFRAVQVDALPYSSTAGPYPGWFYGVPIGVMIAGTALVAVLALVRVSSAPRPTDTTLREVDQIMRMILTRVVAKFAAGTFTVYVGGMVFFGGAALQAASTLWQMDGSSIFIEPSNTIGVILQAIGLVVFAVGVALLALGAIDALKSPFSPRFAPASVASGAV